MTTETPTPSTDDAPDLEGFQVEPEPGAPESAPGEATDAASGPTGETAGDEERIEVDPADLDAEGYFNYPAFHRAWITMHHMPGEAVGLHTLMEAPDSAPGKRASRAIYNTMRESPTLRVMLRPGGKWIYRIFVVGSYGWALNTALRVEIGARKAAAEAPADAPGGGAEEESISRSKRS